MASDWLGIGKGKIMNIKTKRGARRRYNAILNKVWRDLAGGTQYGIDWNTLAIVAPSEYAELKDIQKRFRGLPA